MLRAVVSIIVVLFLAAVVGVVLLIRRAPEGHEGKNGFRYGTAEKNDGSTGPAPGDGSGG